MSQGRTFGLVLKQWRTQAGLSLRELEEAVGMSAANLSRLERGLVGPPPNDKLDKLAGVLGVPAQVLYAAAGRLPASADQQGTAEAFGQVLNTWRTKADLSLRQLEDATGMSAINLSRIERGLVAPPPDFVLDKLASALAVPRAALYMAAGRLPPSSDRPGDAIDAIMADPVLTDDEKAYLVQGLILLRSRHEGGGQDQGVASEGTAVSRWPYGDEAASADEPVSDGSAPDERAGG